MFLLSNGKKEILGSVPIGNFPEKDFFYVYPDVATQAQIIDSRWSIHGRSDFVNIVKDHKDFNGGIYTDFPNVDILVKEGRHYIKQSKDEYDLIVMALPSTEQMQSMEPFAMNENYLLTEEAIEDYLNTLTQKGRLIFTCTIDGNLFG